MIYVYMILQLNILFCYDNVSNFPGKWVRNFETLLLNINNGFLLLPNIDRFVKIVRGVMTISCKEMVGNPGFRYVTLILIYYLGRFSENLVFWNGKKKHLSLSEFVWFVWIFSSLFGLLNIRQRSLRWSNFNLVPNFNIYFWDGSCYSIRSTVYLFGPPKGRFYEFSAVSQSVSQSVTRFQEI